MSHASQVMRSARRCALLALIVVFAAATAPGAGAQEPQDYTIGPRDVLRIRVFNQFDLSGTFTVGLDGSLSFPLVGRVVAGGRTASELEELLRERLAAGYLTDPRVSVAVAEYRSRQVFVLGQVSRPGAYPLAGPMTVVELLARAGGATALAAEEAVVVRGGALAAGPDLPAGGAGADTGRLNLEALAQGDLSQNVTLRNGDTIFVPRADVAYVFGEVREPGQYAIRNGTTVLQLLSLARGGTEFSALNRIRIVRTVGGEQVEIPAELSDPVLPDDVVRVPERFF